MSKSKENLNAIDEAISTHIRDSFSDKVMVVGWVVSVATKEVGGENFDSNGFAYFSSENFAEYSQVGLMQTVLDDKRNSEVAAGIVGNLVAIMNMNQDNDDD